MKITTIKEEVSRENNSKRTIVKVYGRVRLSDPREIKELVPVGKEFVGIGISNCHPQDTPDDILGFRIARSKAYKNLYNQVMAECFKRGIKYQNRLKITTDSIDKYSNASTDQGIDVFCLSTGISTEEFFSRIGNELFDDEDDDNDEI